MKIYRASIEDLNELTLLFNGYIMFYRQTSDPTSCREFLKLRIEKSEATIFMAKDENDNAAGFTLLYPFFSSVSRAKVFVLNDLYIDPAHRRKGIGSQLLARAVSFGRENGAIRLQLETESSNTSAQSLYEREGWKKEMGEIHYYYTL